MEKNCLQLFTPETQAWFRETLGEPTPVQEASWPAIAAGGHVLVSAPTGTGKTLSAFLVFLDTLKKQAGEGSLKRELQLIYVSPLKSLASDIRENLKRPLEGIGASQLISVAIRTGDTTQRERQQMVRKPPHILIITPESLYLMLTGRAGQSILGTAKAVIVDELHALIDTKRGAHLMLSLARLDMLCKRKLQRIGLSATISPLSDAARYLAPEPVFVAAPSIKKEMRLEILGSYVDVSRRKKDPVWQELSELVYQYCQGKRSVLAFVEGRRYAEKLAYYVNLIAGDDFARVHHGSLSKEQRQETEQALREGRLRLLCATSSMELGIDVGEIDQVLQVGCPRTISSAMQRLGRAGHNPNRTSVMYLFPRTAAECVLCGMTASLARRGDVERMNPPEGCLDVLSQHLVSMAVTGSYTVDDVMELLPRAWPFRNVTKEDVKSVLCMLAGDYEHRRDIPVRPRILYDRIHGTVEGDGYSRMLAVSAGGTIPDKGLYTVRTAEGVKIGEADEEFVYETRRGDRFVLGAFAWKVLEIGRDTVTVTQAKTEGARLPFWHGELKGRDKETGAAFGRILRSLQEAEEDGRLRNALAELGLDGAAAGLAEGYIRRQLKATGTLPGDRTIIAEHFRDQSGNAQLMIHSVFGRRINAPLSLLAAGAAEREMHENVGSVDDEDGFLLYSYGKGSVPEGLLYRLDPDTVREILGALLPSTPVFNMAFRYNCGRALMMGVRGKSRQPLWMQRLRSSEMLDQVVRDRQHPLMRETTRECMEQFWDVEGVLEILHAIRSGEILVREVYTDTGSPMSLPFQWGQEAAVMYDYAPTPGGVHNAVGEALEKALGQRDDLLPPGEEELALMQERTKLPQDEKQLHSLLMAEGDLAAGELDIPVEWLETLEGEGRAVYLEQGLWIAAEHEEEYRAVVSGETCCAEKSELPGGAAGSGADNGAALCGKIDGAALRGEADGAAKGRYAVSCPADREKALFIVRRMLRYRGASSAGQIAARYGWSAETARSLLEELCGRGEAVSQKENLRQEARDEADAPKTENCGETAGIRYYHAEVYKRARMRTVRNRREEITTCAPAAYAALIASRMHRQAPPEECVEAAISSFAGTSFPAALWEELLLPSRVKNYREAYLDALLSGGEYVWRMDGDRVCFERAERIDWDAEPRIPWEALSDQERLVAQTLQRRGACFAQALGAVMPGESVSGALLSLVEKGVVCADSFAPVRHLLKSGKLQKAAAGQRVRARVKALHAGRFELVRPLRELTLCEQMERCCDRYLILCRETAAAFGLSWQEALSVLRVQEYTGQMRRGYFVRGLSGTQFIRRKDFESVTSFLLRPQRELVWQSAADPMQLWGKILAHEEGRAFLNVQGSAVALWGGLPAVVFEKQGRTLRILGDRTLPAEGPDGERALPAEGSASERALPAEGLDGALSLFAEEFCRGRIFGERKRIVVKEYPKEAVRALEKGGFVREMQDYVLYR